MKNNKISIIKKLLIKIIYKKIAVYYIQLNMLQNLAQKIIINLKTQRLSFYFNIIQLNNAN